MGIGDWVKNPGELILSHDMAEQVMQYRYLLGGDLLIDMAEQRSVKIVPLDRLLEELTEALKNRKKRAGGKYVSGDERFYSSGSGRKKPCLYVFTADRKNH